MEIKSTKLKRGISRTEWDKVKKEIKKKGQQADRRKCKLDRGLIIPLGMQ